GVAEVEFERRARPAGLSRALVGGGGAREVAFGIEPVAELEQALGLGGRIGREEGEEDEEERHHAGASRESASASTAAMRRPARAVVSGGGAPGCGAYVAASLSRSSASTAARVGALTLRRERRASSSGRARPRVGVARRSARKVRRVCSSAV